MLISSSYSSVFSQQIAKANHMSNNINRVNSPNTYSRRSIENINSSDSKSQNPKNISVGNRAKYVAYTFQNQQTVRIIFSDGSLLVGTFYDKTI